MHNFYERLNGSGCRAICTKQGARLPTLTDFDTTDNSIKYMNTVVGETSKRTPNSVLMQFGRRNGTNDTSTQDYFDKPMFKRPKLYTIDEIHVDAHFDIVQNKGYWLNGKFPFYHNEEIKDDDWYNPEPGPNTYKYATKQPHNPNSLAIVTGAGLESGSKIVNYPGIYRL